jgi:hypothetical protein
MQDQEPREGSSATTAINESAVPEEKGGSLISVATNPVFGLTVGVGGTAYAVGVLVAAHSMVEEGITTWQAIYAANENWLWPVFLVGFMCAALGGYCIAELQYKTNGGAD